MIQRERNGEEGRSRTKRSVSSKVKVCACVVGVVVNVFRDTTKQHRDCEVKPMWKCKESVFPTEVLDLKLKMVMTWIYVIDEVIIFASRKITEMICRL